MTAETTAVLERAIDGLLAEHRLRPAFVVPGSTPASAALDLARTFLRRAERRLIAGRQEGMSVSGTLVAYVNRASDLAYALVRAAVGEEGEPLSHGSTRFRRAADAMNRCPGVSLPIRGCPSQIKGATS